MPDSTTNFNNRPDSVKLPTKFAPTPTVQSEVRHLVKASAPQQDPEDEYEEEEEEEEEESESDPTIQVVNKSRGSYDPVKDRMIVIETDPSDLFEESLVRFNPDEAFVGQAPFD